MEKYKVLENQSLFDVSTQLTGNAETAFLLAVANNISLTDELIPGQELTPVAVQNKGIADYYSSKALKPTTGITGDDLELARIFDNPFDDSFN